MFRPSWKEIRGLLTRFVEHLLNVIRSNSTQFIEIDVNEYSNNWKKMLNEPCATYKVKKLCFIHLKKEVESTVIRWTQHYRTTFLVLFALTPSETFFFARLCERRCFSSLFIRLIPIFERCICTTINSIGKRVRSSGH